MTPAGAIRQSYHWAVDQKRCSECGETKPLSDFNVEAAKADGHQNYYRDCNRTYNAGYRAGRARGD